METNKTFHPSPANLLSIQQAALSVHSKHCCTQAASHWISIPVTLVFPFFAWFSLYRIEGKIGVGNMVPDIKFSSSPSLMWLFEMQENRNWRGYVHQCVENCSHGQPYYKCLFVYHLDCSIEYLYPRPCLWYVQPGTKTFLHAATHLSPFIKR